MYTIDASAVIAGGSEQVWSTATDVNRWSSWDPHEEDARLDAPFVVGAVGWSKPRGGPASDWVITEVIEGNRWRTRCALPGGAICSENTFENLGEGRVRATRSMQVSGPLVPLFRLYFGPRIRRDMAASLAALELEVARREVL